MRLADLRPGWRTEFIAHRHGALITEHADCIAVRTPANPAFYWGNFLLLPQAPADGDLAHWLHRFDEEIATPQPASGHVAIGVNEAPPTLQLPAWQAAGFKLIPSAVLSLRRGGLQAPARPPRGDVRFHVMDLQRDVDTLVTLECADTDGFEPVRHAEYRRRRFAHYAAMASAGAAAWFALRCDGEWAADCGLLRDGTLGRFQHVSTHPGYRRRGLCTALVHGVAEWGLREWSLDEVVMCADPGDVAIGIYQGLGWQRIADEWLIQRDAPGDRLT